MYLHLSMQRCTRPHSLFPSTIHSTPFRWIAWCCIALYCIASHAKQEDKRNRQLQYACRLCPYTEPAPNQPLIYRNDLKKEVGNILHTVPSAISDDPTLARTQNANCANCNHHEAVFFQSDIAQADSLALIFVCCNCDHKWVN